MGLSQPSEKIVDALGRQITELHAEWKTLIALFGTSEEQSRFLNEVAGVFFDTVYRALLRDVLLGISRLTDRPSTTGKDNLVLECLCQLPEVAADETLRSTVTEKLAEIKSNSHGIREHRHKYLAHLDLNVALDRNLDLLGGLKRRDVERVLDGIAEIFNVIEQSHRDRTVMFGHVSIHDGAETLLRHLDDARSWRALDPAERRRLMPSGRGAVETAAETAVNRDSYGGFWIRCAAHVVDFVVLLLPTLTISYLYRAVTPASSALEQTMVDVVDTAINFCVWWIYTAVLLSSSWQATLGKKVVGLKVVDYRGNTLTFQRATGRYFATFVSAILLFLGVVMIAWTNRRQALHDFMAKTLVVKTSHVAA